MKATAIFYNDSTDCVLAAPNAKGGTTYTIFDSVSTMLNYANENGFKITEVETI